MAECINCNSQTRNVENELGSYEHCSECESILIDYHDFRNSTVKKKFLSDSLITAALYQATDDRTSDVITCPECHKKMAVILDEVTEAEMHVCNSCKKFWFPIKNLKLFPQKEDIAKPVIQSERRSVYGTPDKAFESNQAIEDAISGAHEKDKRFSNVGEFTQVSNIGEGIAGLFGLQIIENDGSKSEKFPIISFTTAIFFFLVWGLTKYDLQNAVIGLSFIPKIWYANFGIKALTSFGFHPYFFHFLFNAYYLVTLGSYLENNMGRLKYVMLILASQLGGLIFHTLILPDDISPLLGASAGISGLFTYFVIMNPNRKIGIILYLRFLFYKLSLNSWIFMIVWFLVQFSFSLKYQVYDMRIISILSIIGGLIVGLLIGLSVKLHGWSTAKE